LYVEALPLTIFTVPMIETFVSYPYISPKTATYTAEQPEALIVALTTISALDRDPPASISRLENTQVPE
jgi:hypothetical protein